MEKKKLIYIIVAIVIVAIISIVTVFIVKDKNVTEVTSDTTKTEQNNQEYKIVFKDEDGSIISTAIYNYGETVVEPAAPSKKSDVRYLYTFAGWTPEVEEVTADVEYTATYSKTKNKYTVTFKNYDGTVLETKRVEYGLVPKYEKDIPSKEGNRDFVYEFTGWTPAVEEVKGNVEYTATYKEEIRKYEVVFKNDDGSIISTAKYLYGETVVVPENPTKEADAEFTYEFSGWTPSVEEEVKTDVEYIATYAKTRNTYTVTFKGYDGQVLDTQVLEYGAIPEYKGVLPEKEGNVEYSYPFTGWTPEIGKITGNIEYIATYVQNKNTYTVTFKNYNGETLDTQSLEYGAIPEYKGIAPKKISDETYNYIFEGWDKELQEVTGDITYIAEYKAEYIEYEIVFKDEDGKIISSETYHYGDTVIAPNEPIKVADKEYTYSFAGWAPSIVEVSGKAEYTAMYAKTKNKYTVTFKDYDGEVLDAQILEYGAIPEYKGELPTKEGNAEYSYLFAGWSPEVAEVTGNTEYTAIYSDTKNTYTVTFKNYDEEILDSQSLEYGVIPEYRGELPTKEGNEEYSYIFAGWTPGIVEVTGNIEYIATYREIKNQYIITFKNHDGEILDTQIVEYGATPEYKGIEPSKETDEEYSYTFSGWMPEVAETTGNAEYTATYTKTKNKYTVTFKNYNGETLDIQVVEYGAIPEYKGSVPTKTSDETYNYIFEGWDKELQEVTGEITYIAEYKAEYIEYEIVFKDEDGRTIDTQTYHYGDTVIAPKEPSKEADEEYSYPFAGWTPNIVKVTGNAEYVATYAKTKNAYTVMFKNYDGEILDTQVLEYGAIPEYKGELPTKTSDETYNYIFEGWDKKLQEVTGNITYTAKYKEEYIEYEIVFKDENGKIIATQTYHYGDTVVVPKEPSKEANKEYTYSFAGWTPEIVEVSANAEYTATYTKTKNKYTIIFKNHYGEILDTQELEYGAIPEYKGELPTQEGNEEYSYSFANWLPRIVEVTGNAEYTAMYAKTKNKYTVTFKDYDGEVLDTQILEYGAIPEYKGSVPTKISDETYNYIFEGWDKKLQEITGNITYTAKYKEEYIEYEIVFKDEDGKIISTDTYHYGDTVIVPKEPIKVADKEYTYSFAGWTPEVVEVSENAEYTATYTKTKNKYKVTFKNHDGEILDTQAVEYGAIPEYKGELPTKEGNAEYSYLFMGWSPEVVEVAGNAEYIATYTQNKNKYTVTFKDYDGKVLDTQALEYGEVPEYKGTKPSREADEKHSYIFVGWDSSIVSVTGEKTYTATYSKTINTYTVTYLNSNNQILGTEVVNYGTKLSELTPPPAQEGYLFIGFKDKELTSTITGNTSLIVKYEIIANVDNILTNSINSANQKINKNLFVINPLQNDTVTIDFKKNAEIGDIRTLIENMVSIMYELSKDKNYESVILTYGNQTLNLTTLVYKDLDFSDFIPSNYGTLAQMFFGVDATGPTDSSTKFARFVSRVAGMSGGSGSDILNVTVDLLVEGTAKTPINVKITLKDGFVSEEGNKVINYNMVFTKSY